MQKYFTNVLAATSALLAATIQTSVHAQDLSIDACPSGELSCAPDLVSHFGNILFGGGIFAVGSSAFGLLFFGLLFGMFVVYGFILAFNSRNDSAVSEAIAAYSQAFVGTILVSGAFVLGRSFATVNVIVDAADLEVNFIARLVAFSIQIIGVILVANIVIQGMRLVVSINEGALETGRKNVIQAMAGAAIVMLAVPVLRLIAPGAFHSGINDELVGVANFLATIFGALAVIGFIIAGVMMIISVDESLRDRAKKLILTCLVAMAVVVAALALVTILLPTTPVVV